MKINKVILITDPEAASIKTATGWVSSTGQFFGDNERLARFHGCTHVPCLTCGKPVEKMWFKCEKCRDAEERKRFDNMPKADWDGKQMLYSEISCRFYDSPADAEDELDELETLDSLQLVLCKPVYARPLHPDRWSDDLPDDGDDFPAGLAAAIADFNTAIRGLVLSWTPGKYAYKIG